HGRRLADPAGSGEQLGGDLLDLTVDVVDEDEDLSHVLNPSFVSPDLYELLVGEERGDLRPAVALVLDDGAGGARRRRGGVDRLRGRGGQAHLGGVDA